MDTGSKETLRPQKQRRSKPRSSLLVELCKDKEIEAGRWVEFSTSRLWRKIKTPSPDIKITLEMRTVNDLKPRRIKLTADHKPIMDQITIDPKKKNRHSTEIGPFLSRRTKIRLKVDGSRFFKWKASLTLTAKEETKTDGSKRTRIKAKDSSTKTRFCLNCGSLVLIGARFCHRCGTDVRGSTVVKRK